MTATLFAALPYRPLARLLLILAAAVLSVPSSAADTKLPTARWRAAAQAEQAAVSKPPAESELSGDLQAAQVEYQQWQNKYNREAFEWHAMSTKIIFGMVMSIVAFGVYLTYLQFRRDARPPVLPSLVTAVAVNKETGPVTGEAPAPVATYTPVSTTFKINASGVEITSQIIGLLILAFSLGFFYLYLKNVYPMQELDAAKSVQAEKR